MGREIERKFLVRDDSWRGDAAGVAVRQGYLSTARECTVRVRVAGDRAWLTIKGPARGLARLEFEYEIPVADAQALLDELCRHPPIEKTRHRVEYGGLVWEVDEFHGANEGLVVAEVELAREDQEVPLPPWVGEEVSHDPRYLNAHLAEHPYTEWGDAPVP